MKNVLQTLQLIALLVLFTGAKAYGQLVNEGFEGTFPPSGWTTINAGTGNNWAKLTDASYVITGTASAYYLYNSTNAANAWMFTPGVSLTAGQTVDYSFKQRVAGSTFPENLKFTVGTSATVAAQTTTLLTLAGVTNTASVTRSGSYTAPSTGTYYFAFNCYSAADQFYLIVDDVLIQVQLPCATPTASAATSITTTTAQANWNLTTGSFIVEYGPTSTFSPVGTGATAGNANNSVVTVSNTNLASLTGLTAGTGYSYVVRQDCTGSGNGYSNNSSTITFTTAFPPPANDDCANATSVTVNLNNTCTVTTPGTINAATASSGAPSSTCGTYDDDVWFSFVATTTTHNITIAPVTGISDFTHQVISGSCGSPVAIVCSDPNSSTASGLTIGQTYYIRVASWTSTTGQVATFTVCVNQPPDMTFTSTTASQVTSATQAGANDQQVIQAQVVTANSQNPLSVTSLSFNTTGTTNVADLANAKVYYTGTSSTFATTTSFGTAIANPNGTLTFTGSQVLASGTNYFWLAYDLPCTATNANVIDGQYTSVTVGGIARTPTTTSPTGSRTITGFTVATNQPSTSAASAGTNNNQVLRLDVVGNASCGQVTQLNLATTGSTAPLTDIVAARVYYTGTTSTFTDGGVSGTQFGSDIVGPNGTMTFTGAQTLATGTNYFFLVYDLPCGATGSNVLDASCASIVYNGTTLTPTTANPTGTRTITAVTFTTASNGNWSSPTTWTCGVPPNGTTSAIIINHNVTVDVDVSIQSTLTVAAGKTLNISTNSLTLGGAGTGTQNLVINGTANVSGSTLNVGTATTGTVTSSSITFGSAGALNVSGGTLNVGTGLVANVTTGNITVASGSSLTLSGTGVINLGPTGGYNRTFTSSGTTTISGGTFNVNGSVSISAGTFNMSSGNLNIDGNTGTSGTSVSSGNSLFAIAVTAVNISGGTILIVDPHLTNTLGSSAFNYTGGGPVVCTGGLFRLGDGISTTPGSSSTTGFYLTPGASTLANRFSFYDLEINGGNIATRLTRNNWDLVVRNTLTINAGSTFSTNDDVWIAKDLVNNGTFTNAGYYTIFGALNSTGPSTSSPTSNVNTITGNGVFNNDPAAPTANFYSLKIDNNSGVAVTIPNNMIFGVGSSSVSNTLLLSNGVAIVSLPLIVGTAGTSSTTAGTVTHTNGWVNGTLVRWVNVATGTRDFPVGTATTKRLMQVNYTSSVGLTAHTLTCSFSESDPGFTGLPVTTQGIVAQFVSPSGYWTVDASVGQTAAYTATVNASGFTKTDGVTAITDLANIRLIKRPTSGSWGTFTSTTTAGPAALSAVSAAGLTGFSQFAIGGTASALPLELSSFTGKTLTTSNMLQWETLTEKNVQSHIVERSIDGIKWTEVGRKAGQLDSQSPLKYQLEDRTPPAKAYYRLRSVDFDGQENLSNTIVLTRKGDQFGITAAFPSPAKDKITVQFASTEETSVHLKVTDLSGRTVLEQEFAAANGINEVPVDLAGLQAGLYLVSILNETATTAPVRIVKE